MSNENDFWIVDGILRYYGGCDCHVLVPDTVKAIGKKAFLQKKEISSVQLPESITDIDDQAFKDCTLLKTINIPKSVKHIGTEAFRNCKNLQIVSFAGNPDRIDPLAFYGCWNLEQNTLPEMLQKFFSRMKSGELFQDEAKILYQFSKSKGAVTLKEFQNVWFNYGDMGKYVYHFEGDEDYLIIPTKIGDLPVVKVPSRQIPENAIVYCDVEQFGKLPRCNKAILAVQWLSGNKMLREELDSCIPTFIKKYAEDVAYVLPSCENAGAYQKFLEIAHPNEEIIEKLIEQLSGKIEVLAVLLNYGNKQGETSLAVSLDDEPKMTVAQLKKLWTYHTYVDEETNENIIEITNYKGHEKHVRIPEYIGKARVKYVSGVFPAEVESVVFPNEKIIVKSSFRNCKSMADPEGFIVVCAGDRHILTDYIGPRDVPVLTIPSGVTENLYGVFRDMEIREAVFRKAS